MDVIILFDHLGQFDKWLPKKILLAYFQRKNREKAKK